MYCAKCGAELNQNVRFCPGCGAPVINDTVIESKGINKKKKVIPLIGIILAAVLICGAIIFLFVFSKGKSDNKNAKENVNIDSGNQYLAVVRNTEGNVSGKL